ncbi:MAG: serine/threonine-protein kinase [Planctomycetales bacterium]
MSPESRYELLEKIGSGSFATVYRARDLELGREVAVKQIHAEYLADPASLDRYWQEAQLLASLQHPNIVTVYDVHREQGWLIMELMQTNLADRMRGRQMDVRALKTTVAHSLRALKYLHARGIVHGDLKPANLMIDSRKRVKLGDFGLARRVSDEEGSLLKGTTKYMAPEVVSDEFGEVGPASDLYSLGFAAYDLLCGPNFEDLFPGLSAFGRNKQVAWMMWHAAPDRRLPEISRVLEGVPEDLAHVIQKLCEKDQTKRYKSADEALADLNVDQRVIRVGDAPAEAPQAGPEDAARRKRLLLLGGAVAFSLVLSLVMLFVPFGGSRPTGNGDSPPTYGLVRKVHPEDGTIVLEDLEEGLPFEVRVGDLPSIYLLNEKQNILLRDLQPLDRVKVEYESAEGQSKVRLTVTRPVTNRGRIESIDRDKSTVTVQLTEGRAETLEIRIPRRVPITVNDRRDREGLRAFTFSDLRVGDEVQIEHLDELDARGGRVAGRIAVTRVGETTGFVEGFDPVGSLLRVKPVAAGFRPQVLSLPVAAGASVTLREMGGSERSVRSHDLRANDRVRVTHDAHVRKIVATRLAEGPDETVVQEIRRDAAKLQVVVTTRDGARVAVDVPRTAEITLGSEPAALDDLRPFDKAWIGYGEGSSVETRIALTLDTARPENPNRWAVLIGIGSYPDKDLASLPWSMSGAERLRDALVRRYGVPDNRVSLVLDEPRAELERRTEAALASVRPQTQLIVYAGCRAFVAEDRRVYLAATDFDSNRPAETGIPLQWLLDRLDRCPSTDKLLLLDVRPAQPAAEAETGPPISAAEALGLLERPPQSTAVIAADSAGETGLDLPERHASLFANAAAEGFRGPADADRDLHITPQELFAFVRDHMAATAPAGAKQTPALAMPGG